MCERVVSGGTPAMLERRFEVGFGHDAHRSILFGRRVDRNPHTRALQRVTDSEV